MGDYPLTPSQQWTWLQYMQVYHRLEYEMNRQLQTDSGVSLGDYTVMNAISQGPQGRTQLTALATVIGWERSRLSHHLVRMERRGLVQRIPSATDRRSTDVELSAAGWNLLREAAPLHAGWVRQAFFEDLEPDQERALGATLAAVYGSLLRAGTLPRPDYPGQT